MDVHVPRAVAIALRLRGVDVLTAQEDRADEFDDSALLNRSTKLGRVLVSQDEDLLREGTFRQRNEDLFSGIIYAHQLRVTIGRMVDDLDMFAKIFLRDVS